MLAALLALSLLAPSDSVTVRIEVAVPGVLAPLDTVYLAGSFNGWNPGDDKMGEPGGGLPMTPLADGHFALDLRVPDGDTLSYKYTLGSWRSVEVGAQWQQRPNREASAHAGLVLRDTVAHWALASVEEGRWLDDEVGMFLAPVSNAWYDRNLHAYAGWETPMQLDSAFAQLEADWAREASRLGYPPVSLYPEVVATVLSAHLSDPHRATHLTRAHVQPYAEAHLDALGTGPVTDERANWLPGLAQTLLYNSLLVAARHAGRASELPALLRMVEGDAERLRLLLSDALDAAPVRYPAREPALAQAIDRVQRLSVLASTFHDVLDDPSPASLAALVPSFRHSDQEVAWLATQLAWTLSRSDDTALALASLDLMMTATDETQVPSDSLRRWYARVDPANGAARFDGLSEQRPDIRLPTVDVGSALGATLTDAVTGQPFDLARLRGKTVVVDFWTTWCGWCLAEIPALQAFAEEVAGRDDFAFVTVLGDETDGRDDDPSIPDADAVIRVRGITYPVLRDTPTTDLTAAFGVEAWPSKFIIRPDGQVEEITRFWRPVVDEILSRDG